MSVGYIAQWLERLTADQQVPGSNPGVPSLFLSLLSSCAAARDHMAVRRRRRREFEHSCSPTTSKEVEVVQRNSTSTKLNFSKADPQHR